MKTLKLFFSWQSDVKGNHQNISDALRESCDNIREEGDYDIRYTESTWERSGSPIIDKVVMDKAKDCDIFVADLTPIDTTNKKYLPNPNVMLELGVAKSCLIDDVILLLYTGNIDANKMPFDINHQRMSHFSKSSIIDYVRQMAKTAAETPRHSSVFDNNDKFLYYDRNVKKNIKSGKYLPNVYLENREVKQHLRDFVDPFPFCKLALERCDMMDIYRINRNRYFRHKSEFVFDVSEFKNIPSEEHLSVFYNRAEALKEYVLCKYNELHGNNSDYLSSSKFGQQVKHLEYIISKILLITTSAGQGKTNLICDLVENVLLKKEIPFVYLNGYEIDANHIEESFARMMLPTSKKSFDEVMKNLSTYCRYKRHPIILIIDGLNENPNPTVFSRNLEVFIDAVLQYDCVKVILTCRTEYYKECFSSFDSTFEGRMLKIENLNMHLHDDEKERLLDNYIQHFNISVGLSDHIKDILCEDLLLLRIFCEANCGRKLGPVHSIKREELFTEYYELMTSNLVDKVKQEEGYTLSSNRVKEFIVGLVEYMIDKSIFFNVPLSYLESKCSKEEKTIFSRFLDENILLRKDLTPEGKGLFGRNEVVNFTYDAFRDYLLSSYLSDFVYENNLQRYKNCIEEYTKREHQLREGLTPFLFVHTKLRNDREAIRFLSKFDWYDAIVEKYIWDIPDELIIKDDIDLISKILNSDRPRYVTHRLIFYSRWDENAFPRLNIRILLNFMSTLNDKELNIFIERVWSEEVERRQWGESIQKSQRTQMIESMDGILDDEGICSNKYFHNLFELLLYISICSDESGINVFMKYFNKYKNFDMLDRVYKMTHCRKLILKIDEIRG